MAASALRLIMSGSTHTPQDGFAFIQLSGFAQSSPASMVKITVRVRLDFIQAGEIRIFPERRFIVRCQRAKETVVFFLVQAVLLNFNASTGTELWHIKL